MAFPMPLVVPKQRTVNLAGAVYSRQQFGHELAIQTKADLHAILVGTAREDTEQQIKLGNPPQIVEVDNRTNVPLDQAKRKIVVLFGTALARAAMQMVETELRQAIDRSTTARSGRLHNIGASWEWRFIPAGGAARIVTAANPPTTFARGDTLVLTPVRVYYATKVNAAVAGGGRLNSYTVSKRSKRPPKSSQNLGFLAATTRALRRRAEFKQFAVRAEFTKAYAVAGELKSQGTGVITIRPRIRSR